MYKPENAIDAFKGRFEENVGLSIKGEFELKNENTGKRELFIKRLRDLKPREIKSI